MVSEKNLYEPDRLIPQSRKVHLIADFRGASRTLQRKPPQQSTIECSTIANQNETPDYLLTHI
jgi:hypothetical protein